MAYRELRRLRTLAALHRVQTSYVDMHGRRRLASPEALLAVLRALDSPVEKLCDVEEALRERVGRIHDEWVRPVMVAWDGQTDRIAIHLPASAHASHAVGPRLQYTLRLENGDIWSGNILIDQSPILRRFSISGSIIEVRRFLPPKGLPLGYHKLTVQVGHRAFHSTVISAPTSCFHSGDNTERSWGIFAPLYALNTKRNWGVGDFTDAGALAVWAASRGGKLLGTLPFLASYLDSPCDPSPYTPISRLFWNELFVDVTRLPELSECAEAQAIVTAATFQSELRALHDNRFVDYKRAMALKRAVINKLALGLRGGSRWESMRAFADANPELSKYTRFRAATSDRGEVWTRWNDNSPDALLNSIPDTHDEVVYHTYAQFVADEQVKSFKQLCTAEDTSLYLDYPLGTHPEGYDGWRFRDCFAMDMTAGAPPDTVFTTGQNWGFHPVHPEHQRRDGYTYLSRSLRQQMQNCDMLRLDHVMGLHRQYWIPQGFHKSEGIYVRYPSDEIYAVICLESNRSQTMIVGENLGIVPGYVTTAMNEHRLSGMNVAYWELASDPSGALQKIAEQPDSVVSLNTHDMFPFAAFWHGLDADRRAELGMITTEQADLERWVRGELRGRLTGYLREHGFPIASEDDIVSALHGMLRLLAGSRARWLLVNIEDLWLETSPQNIPDTVDEHPNWRQKLRLTLEELVRDTSIDDILTFVNRARRMDRR